MQKKIYTVLCLFACFFSLPHAFAQTYNWNLTTQGDWGTGTNWTPTGPPNGSNAAAVFGTIITSPAVIALAVAPGMYTIFEININNTVNSYTIGQAPNFGPLTLQGAPTAFLVITGTHTIAADLILNSPTNFNGISGFLTISGTVSGTAGLTVQAGTLSLTGTNSYSGGTILTGGVLSGNTSGIQGEISFQSPASLIFSQTVSGTFSGSCTGTVGTIQVNDPSATIFFTGNNSLFSGTTAIGSSTTLSVGATNALPVGPITMATGATLQAGVGFSSASSIALSGTDTFNLQTFPVTLSGVISGTGPLTVMGTGASSLTLSGNNSAFTGQININGTTVAIGAANNLGTGTVSMTNGTLLISPTSGTVSFTLPSNFILNATETFNLNGNNTVTLSGNISGTGSLNEVSGGTLILSGSNTYSGGSTVTSSTLQGTTTSLQGNIALAGTAPVVTFLQTSSGTYAGNLSGTVGTVNVSATGQSITFTGTNTGFSGTLNLGTGTVDTTTLVVGGISALPVGPLNMANGTTLQAGVTFSSGATPITLATGTATFNVPSTFTMTLSGAIGGAGALVTSGTGTVILTGANSYTGGTNVTAGTLQGNGSAPSLQGAINVASGAALIFNETATGTYSGNLSGAGSLTVQGGSSLVMNGNNGSFTGPTTITGATTLQYASTTALPSGTATITLNGGTLQGGVPAGLAIPNPITFVGTSNAIDTNGNPMTVSGSMTGTGGFTKIGNGTLFVTGTANTYSGGTTITNGILQGTSATLEGTFTITSSGQLTFNQTFPGTTGIVIAGTNGTLNVQGGSSLTFTGSSPNFMGSTLVSGSSTLVMNGNLQGSSVSVQAGSTLTGTGSVGSTTIASGTLEPGASGGGTLSVNGTLTFSGSPTFLINLTPTTSGFASVTGAASLAGNVTIDPNIGSSFFGVSKTYTILTASTLSGTTFNPGVLSTDPSFTGSLAYTPTSVLLTVLVPQPFLGFSFGNVNERNVGSNINAIPLSADMTAVIDALAGQSTSAVNNALDQMHPAALSAFAELQAEIGTQLLSTFHRSPAVICFGCNKPNRVWVEPFGDWLREKKRGIEIGFWSRTRGVAFGYDRQFYDCWTVGFGGAWNSASLKWSLDRGYSYLSGLYGSFYTDFMFDKFYLGGSVYAGKDWYDTARHIHFTTIDRQAKSMSSAVDAGGQITGAYFFGSQTYLLYPYGTINCLYLNRSSLQERGANSLNLHIEEYTSKTLRLETGAAFQWTDRNRSGTFCIAPLFALGYAWEKPYRDHLVSTFKGQTLPFISYGWHKAWNFLNVRFGLKLTYHCVFLDSQYIADAAVDEHAFLLNQRANFQLGYSF